MRPKLFEKFNPGIGATEEFSLRVSVATLVRVLFKNPRDGDSMLALERKATLHKAENERIIEVKCQPFGGAIRILDLKRIQELIGDFHFDNERSRSEQDFRIFIRPTDWPVVREFCIQHLMQDGDPILETDPGRELAEEFADALKIKLKPDQYIHKPEATVVEDNPAATENIHAEEFLTARVYRIFEATITDSSLALAMITNNESLSDANLQELVRQNEQSGGKGRANAILAIPIKRITDFYLAVSPQERNLPVSFEKNRLGETVPVVLKGIAIPKYQRLIEYQ
jgi:hypothetical protein